MSPSRPDVLHDHVDHHVPVRHGGEQLRANARQIRQVDHRDPGLRVVELHFADDDVLHARQPLHDSLAAIRPVRPRLSPTGLAACIRPPAPRAPWHRDRTPACTALSGLSAPSRLTSTEILMSLVVIISMLTPASASDWNICAATPVCVRMPAPTTETFDTFVPLRTVAGAEFVDGAFGGGQRLGQIVLRDGERRLRPLPPLPTFCTTMSTGSCVPPCWRRSGSSRRAGRGIAQDDAGLVLGERQPRHDTAARRPPSGAISVPARRE